jgi:hypothetical protein
VEKVSKFVNKSHAIYAYIITSEELWYTFLLVTYSIIQLLGVNTLVCSIVTTGIATVRIVRYIRNISE